MLDIFATPQTDQDSTKEHQAKLQGGQSFTIGPALKGVLDKIGADDQAFFWMTDGAWSMIDMLVGLLQKFGRCEVTLSSYAFSEKPARVIADLKHTGVITKLECIIDSRVDVRAASALTLIQNCADRCVLCDTHAKITMLRSAENKCITVVGSANYTSNKRYEAGIITCSEDVYNFYYGWINLAMDRRDADQH
jgi:hypothetical protein